MSQLVTRTFIYFNYFVFTGTLFAYGQTSSGKTYTMMGDQQSEGVIPKAVGELYDYIQKVCYDWKFLAWIYKVFAGPGMKS